MTKKRISNQQMNPETFLIKSKDQFRTEILDRITLGKQLLESPIRTNEDFTKLRSDFSSWNDYNLELLKQSFSVEYNTYRKNYDDSGTWSGTRIRTVGATTQPGEQLQKLLNKISSKTSNLERLEQKIKILKSNTPITEKNTPPERDKTKVFIVHGHDDSTKNEVARFVEKLGFDAIILHEQASAGKTIIEKIEHFSNVGFGIVLYTACDVGAKAGNEANLNHRARQNVVFEHGYLIGKIGRENVCALVKGNVEKPNDISGVVYVSLDDEWKIQLAKELINCGYDFDASLMF
jgi:predicted nucleotide-binding protein